MLTIHEGFPIKKMALYGSTAFIVGFAGTLTMLREYAPKTDSGNISVVHPSNSQEAKTNVSNQVPKGTDSSKDQTTADAAAPLAQSTPVASGGVLSTRQASPVSITPSTTAPASSGAVSVTPTPTASEPTVSSSPQPGSGGTTTQPEPTDTTGIIPPISGLQDTVTDVTNSTNLLP